MKSEIEGLVTDLKKYSEVMVIILFGSYRIFLMLFLFPDCLYISSSK